MVKVILLFETDSKKPKSLIFFSLLILFLTSADLFPQKMITASLTDQKGIILTLYQDQGHIQEIREVQIPQGEIHINWINVASKIIPSSIVLFPASAKQNIQIKEQQYVFDLQNTETMLEKFIGKEIKIARKNPQTGEENIITAQLLSTQGGNIYKIGEDITFGDLGRIILPSAVQTLVTQPTISFLLRSTEKLKSPLTLSYFTLGLSWHTDYLLILASDERSLRLTGRAMLENQAGIAFKNAQIKLIAGEVHQAAHPASPLYRAALSAESVLEQSLPSVNPLFEYYQFSLPGRINLEIQEMKQVTLVEGNDIHFVKKFKLASPPQFYPGHISSASPGTSCEVILQIENKKENKLGMPLAKGLWRVYQSMESGHLDFLGEDELSQIPKDEKIEINVGKSFDVIAERTQTQYKRIKDNLYEMGYEIKLKNHKPQDAVVEVVETLNGSWKILSSSHAYLKIASDRVLFNIKIPKEKTVILTYSAELKY